MVFVIPGLTLRMVLSGFLPKDTFQHHDARKGILPSWKRPEAVRMLLPGQTTGKATGSSYKLVAAESTCKHIHTREITVPDVRNDFAHASTMRATCLISPHYFSSKTFEIN